MSKLFGYVMQGKVRIKAHYTPSLQLVSSNLFMLHRNDPEVESKLKAWACFKLVLRMNHPYIQD